jgi:hypothetical protein
MYVLVLLALAFLGLVAALIVVAMGIIVVIVARSVILNNGRDARRPVSEGNRPLTCGDAACPRADSNCRHPL